MSNISEIDKNFLPPKLNEEDIKWFDANENPFSLYGVFYDGENGEYRRVPKNISSKVSFAFDFLSANTSGGRLRFKTNSPYIAIKAVELNCGIMSHMPINGQCGFSLYIDGKFGGSNFSHFNGSFIKYRKRESCSFLGTISRLLF